MTRTLLKWLLVGFIAGGILTAVALVVTTPHYGDPEVPDAPVPEEPKDPSPPEQPPEGPEPSEPDPVPNPDGEWGDGKTFCWGHGWKTVCV